MIDIAMTGRYQFRLPVEIRGTWRRDGRSIAATLANERKRIAEARVAFVLASAAVGPRLADYSLYFRGVKIV